MTDPMNDAQELRAAVDLVGLGRYRQDPVTQLIEWDIRLKAMWGLPPDAAVDLGLFIAGIHPEDRERVQAALGQSVDPEGDGVCDIEYRVVGVNGDAERWVATRGKTVFDQGRVVSFHGVVLDISERKRAEYANMMLIAELEHRTHNLLAVVDALAEQTLLVVRDARRFRGAVSRTTRDALACAGIAVARLDDSRHDPRAGELELRALGAETNGTRVVIEGPEVALPNSSVQILALGLHELATNARKYGALGAPNGSLAVRWRVKRNGPQSLLVLGWAEDGIASRRASNADLSRVGLGRTLIEKSIPYQLDAQTRLEITHDTVRCDVTIALDRSDPQPTWDALR